MPWSDSVDDPVADLDGAQRFIQERRDERSKGGAHRFAVVDKATGRMLGGGGSSQTNRRHDIADIASWVRSSERARGIAVAEVRLLALFRFGASGLQQSQSVVEPTNGSSSRVAEKTRAVRGRAAPRPRWTARCRHGVAGAGRPLDVITSDGRSGPDGSRCRR